MRRERVDNRAISLSLTGRLYAFRRTVMLNVRLVEEKRGVQTVPSRVVSAKARASRHGPSRGPDTSAPTGSSPNCSSTWRGRSNAPASTTSDRGTRPYGGESFGGSTESISKKRDRVPRQDPSVVAALMTQATSKIASCRPSAPNRLSSLTCWRGFGPRRSTRCGRAASAGTRSPADSASGDDLRACRAAETRLRTTGTDE